MRLKLKNFLNTIESFIRTDATVARVYQFPDRDITIAGTDDVATVQSDATQAISDAAAAQATADAAATPADLTSVQNTLQINIDTKLDKKVATVDVTDNVTLALTDIYKNLKVDAATAKTITIPLQATVAWETGMWFLVEWVGVGQPAIAPVSGSVTITSSSSGLTVPVRYGVMYVEYLGSNAWRAQNGGLPVANMATIPIFFSGTGIAATNQAAAEQWFPGGGAAIYKFDATNYNYIRIGIRMIVIGASGARAYPVYDTDLGTIATTIIGAGTTASGEAINYNTALSVNTGWRETSWIALPAGAKADVYFGIREVGGDGVADPAYSLGYIQFRV